MIMTVALINNWIDTLSYSVHTISIAFIIFGILHFLQQIHLRDLRRKKNSATAIAENNTALSIAIAEKNYAATAADNCQLSNAIAALIVCTLPFSVDTIIIAALIILGTMYFNLGRVIAISKKNSATITNADIHQFSNALVTAIAENNPALSIEIAEKNYAATAADIRQLSNVIAESNNAVLWEYVSALVSIDDVDEATLMRILLEIAVLRVANDAAVEQNFPTSAGAA